MMFKANIIILITGVCSVATGATTNWTNAFGNNLFRNSANWDAGLPGSGTGGYARIGLIDPDHCIVDANTNHTIGLLDVGTKDSWGANPARGELRMTGGTLTINYYFDIGYGGKSVIPNDAAAGKFYMDGGTLTICAIDHSGAYFAIGNLEGTDGSMMEVTDGVINMPNQAMTVGNTVSASLILKGGVFTMSKADKNANFGQGTHDSTDDPGIGTLTVDGGQFQMTGGGKSQLKIGAQNGGVGYLNMLHGSVFVDGAFTIGMQGSTGTMIMDGGSVETTGDFNIGRTKKSLVSTGTATITGGTFIIGGAIKIGSTDGTNISTGQMNISGTVVETGDLTIVDGNLHLGEGGTLIINRNRETRIHEYITAELMTSDCDAIDVSYDAVINQTTVACTVPLEVLTPNGGESWITGTVEDIAWTVDPTISRIYLDYSPTDTNDWIVIDPNTGNDGQYTWTLPEITSDQCIVRVSDADDPNLPSNPAVYDVSDDTFTIFECQITSPADLDDDCYVSSLDLAAMAVVWLGNDPNIDIAPEPTGDGIVNFEDFNMLAHDWLLSGNPYNP
jgi:hypothetical protein